MKSPNEMWIWEPIITVAVYRHKRTGEISHEVRLTKNFTASQLSKMLTETIIEMGKEQRLIDISQKRLIDIRDLIGRV